MRGGGIALTFFDSVPTIWKKDWRFGGSEIKFAVMGIGVIVRYGGLAADEWSRLLFSCFHTRIEEEQPLTRPEHLFPEKLGMNLMGAASTDQGTYRTSILYPAAFRTPAQSGALT